MTEQDSMYHHLTYIDMHTPCYYLGSSTNNTHAPAYEQQAVYRETASNTPGIINDISSSIAASHLSHSLSPPKTQQRKRANGNTSELTLGCIIIPSFANEIQPRARRIATSTQRGISTSHLKNHLPHLRETEREKSFCGSSSSEALIRTFRP